MILSRKKFEWYIATISNGRHHDYKRFKASNEEDAELEAKREASLYEEGYKLVSFAKEVKYYELVE